MSDLIEFWSQPDAEELYLIAGWRQWADAGAISSGLPQYLIERAEARYIGKLLPNGYYLFQIPGTHHLLRPEIKLREGYRARLTTPTNKFYYAGNEKKGLVLFLGDEPHLNVDAYAEAFFSAAQHLKVRRVGVVGGVYGAMPYDRDRSVSCVYSLRALKPELARYAVNFSNYEGGATIGAYLLDRAERLGIEFVAFYAFVPAYDFGQSSEYAPGVRIENDFKAWYELMRRYKHMFRLDLDLGDLEKKSRAVVETLDAKVAELEREMPQLQVREYLDQVGDSFTEKPFAPLDDMWDRELDDLFRDLDD